MTQLNLFSDYGSDAEIIVFPFGRRAALARAIATQLAILNRGDGKKFWESKCREIRADLRRQGVTPKSVRSQIDGLADAVHEELRTDRRSWKFRLPGEVIPLTSRRRAALRRGSSNVRGDIPVSDDVSFNEDAGSRDPIGAA